MISPVTDPSQIPGFAGWPHHVRLITSRYGDCHKTVASGYYVFCWLNWYGFSRKRSSRHVCVIKDLTETFIGIKYKAWVSNIKYTAVWQPTPSES